MKHSINNHKINLHIIHFIDLQKNDYKTYYKINIIYNQPKQNSYKLHYFIKLSENRFREVCNKNLIFCNLKT